MRYGDYGPTYDVDPIGFVATWGAPSHWLVSGEVSISSDWYNLAQGDGFKDTTNVDFTMEFGNLFDYLGRAVGLLP